jgi:isoleucyl-tRNA synthetase
VFLPAGSPPPPHGIVEDELNVDALDDAGDLAEVLRFELVPNFKTLGPRLGESVKHLKKALQALDGGEAAAALEEGRSVSVELPDGPVELGPDDLELRVRAQEGFAVSREGGEVVALDLALTDDLRRRGLVRDVIRQVQELRKTKGLELADRIELHLVGLDDLAPSDLNELAHEVLATSVTRVAGHSEATSLELDHRPEAAAWLAKDA